jgi:hypothetical protein
MKYYFSFIAILLFISCREPLSFSSSNTYNIEEVLTAVNCEADCEEMADCEGIRANIIGTIDEANINAATNNFFMIDRFESQVDLEIRVDTMITAEVFSLISDKGGFNARITGLLQGEDGTGSNCEREIYMILDDLASLDIIE